jgi:N6-L-threonylcarbamoyladenine synthase
MTPVVLGIESSCDETGVGLVRGRRVLADALRSSADLQTRYGGVVPEVAAREHVAALPALIDTVLSAAGVAPEMVDAVAVTVGPGLLGPLLVGLTAAKCLALAWHKPLIPVHHLEAHLYANAADAPVKFPALALLVSGGHTGLWLWQGHGRLRQLASTRDDAAGEALDKGARLLGLPYPGGPRLEELAERFQGRRRVRLPVARLRDDSGDWSFSGLKTALARGLAEAGASREEWADALQDAVVEALVGRVAAWWRRFPVPRLYVAGGVAANRRLRTRLGEWAEEAGVSVHIPPRRYCTDNGVMVALAGAAQWRRRPPARLDIGPSTPFPLGETLTPSGAMTGSR